jgi:acetoin utilization deacetylase AcuC-like enzyme
MKVVYHERYSEVYSGDPAATAGRMESIYEELYGRFDFVEPLFAGVDDLKLVHTQDHVNFIKRKGIYENALLAVGGAIKASELAVKGEPAFGLIRPPGHHASSDSCWGFCFFNNIAISVEKLRNLEKIKKAIVVDIDLHYGDGTANIFQSTPEVSYFHMPGGKREEQLKALSEHLDSEEGYDLIAVSAGFDRHVEDWGGTLTTEDYKSIGRMIKKFAERVCKGRRYGVLEGGYSHRVLGKNVRSLIESMK